MGSLIGTLKWINRKNHRKNHHRRQNSTPYRRRNSLLPRDLLELRGDCFGNNDAEDLAAMSFLAPKRIRTGEKEVG